MNHPLKWTMLVTVIVLAAGCSTIKLKPGAAEVEVLQAERVADCKMLGKTKVSVADKLGFVPRGDKAIRVDLQRLARNSAIEMNGDTLSPESEIVKGEQTFGVYDCI